MAIDPERQPPRYAVPAATARLVEQFGSQCQNLGLMLDKFVPRAAIGEGKLQANWMLPARHEQEQRGRQGQRPDENEWFKGMLRPNQRQDAKLWEERYMKFYFLVRTG
jgi:hypothetical protein